MTDHTLDPERPTPIVPALAPVWDRAGALAWPLVRVATGAMLIPHGWAKVFGGGIDGFVGALGQMGMEPAFLLGWYVALLELVGGALLVVGLLTRLVAVQVVAFMAIAAFVVHWPKGFMWTAGGYEYPLYWGLVALAIVFAGGGRASLDWLIGREV